MGLFFVGTVVVVGETMLRDETTLHSKLPVPKGVFIFLSGHTHYVVSVLSVSLNRIIQYDVFAFLVP